MQSRLQRFFGVTLLLAPYAAWTTTAFLNGTGKGILPLIPFVATYHLYSDHPIAVIVIWLLLLVAFAGYFALFRCVLRVRRLAHVFWLAMSADVLLYLSLYLAALAFFLTLWDGFHAK